MVESECGQIGHHAETMDAERLCDGYLPEGGDFGLRIIICEYKKHLPSCIHDKFVFQLYVNQILSNNHRFR